MEQLPLPQSIHNKLRVIQQKLNAPKDLRNNFGGYNYRSCESILKAVKPLLEETETTLMFDDDIVLIGDRFYVKATATLSDASGATATSHGFAREDLAKKGMDGAQLTGATSSYARKYALNALFAIDDNKDADTTNKHKTDKKSIIEQALTEIHATTTLAELKTVYNKYLSIDPSICAKNSEVYKAVGIRGEELKQLAQ